MCLFFNIGEVDHVTTFLFRFGSLRLAIDATIRAGYDWNCVARSSGVEEFLPKTIGLGSEGFEGVLDIDRDL